MPKYQGSDLTRRTLLTKSAGLVALSGAIPAAGAAARPQAKSSEAGEDEQRGADNPGPQNPSLHAQNPDSFMPPATDHGDSPSFKYSFSLSHNRREEGGWARQVTIRDFPISREMAGVNMRLLPGGIRELHWHLPAEWSYMLYGSARITAVDRRGKSFVRDVKKGDLWYFPSGIPHSIQGLDPDGAEFLLVFDDGAFSEFDTFQITDWMAHTPREALSKNLGVSASALDPIPKHELYIFKAPVPGPLAADQQAAAGAHGTVDEPYSYELLAQPPTKRTQSGEVRIADSTNFKASKTIAAAFVSVRPGGMRELHWHPNADEWQYYVAGKGRMSLFAAGGRARTMDFDPGDVGYVPRSMGHYIENIGTTDLTFLEIFRTDEYMDISLSDWISHTPPELVAQHLRLDRATLNAIPKDKLVIVPG